jgi:hypothetical protein
VTALTPAQREMNRRGRRMIAERLHWPAGAVEACEHLEATHPGFSVSWFEQWRSAVKVFNREAGFYAWREGENPGQMWGTEWVGRTEWYGATSEELAGKLATLA